MFEYIGYHIGQVLVYFLVISLPVFVIFLTVYKFKFREKINYITYSSLIVVIPILVILKIGGMYGARKMGIDMRFIDGTFIFLLISNTLLLFVPCGFVSFLKKQKQGKVKKLESIQAGAENNEIEDVFLLAGRYFFGKEVLKDRSKAIELYVKAAEQGHCEAIFNLGRLYYEGTYIDQDKVKAKKLISEAFELGSKQAKFFWDKNELWEIDTPET